MIELFEREELQALIKKAQANKTFADNPEWKLAYDQFILACSTLDAFIARSSVLSCMSDHIPIEIGTEGGCLCEDFERQPGE